MIFSGLSGAVLAATMTVAALPGMAGLAQAATPPAEVPVATALCQPAFMPPANLKGRVSALCGIHAPEDVEVMADGRHLIVSETRGMDKAPGALGIVDIARQRAGNLPRIRDGKPGWGDPQCTDLGADAPFEPHGISLGRRRDGATELLVVNHAEREAIDFFEIRHADKGQGLVAAWRGCVENHGTGMFNDVSISPLGGFVATIMSEKAAIADQPGQPKGSGIANMLSAANSGYLMAWAPGQPFERLAGSDAAFNNGVQVSADGRLVYFAAWTAKRLETYDLSAQKITASIPIDFLPDNLSVGPDGSFFVAGITDLALWRACATRHLAFCASGFEVAQWWPATGKVQTVFSGPPGLTAGASVAAKAGGALYIGSFSGDRLLRVTIKP